MNPAEIVQHIYSLLSWIFLCYQILLNNKLLKPKNASLYEGASVKNVFLFFFDVFKKLSPTRLFLINLLLYFISCKCFPKRNTALISSLLINWEHIFTNKLVNWITFQSLFRRRTISWLIFILFWRINTTSHVNLKFSKNYRKKNKTFRAEKMFSIEWIVLKSEFVFRMFFSCVSWTRENYKQERKNRITVAENSSKFISPRIWLTIENEPASNFQSFYLNLTFGILKW